MKISTNCGTESQKFEVIELEDYGTRRPTSASEDDVEKARKVLEDLMTDRRFADDGRRNDDAVDSCIALHVLGFDPLAWFEAWTSRQDDHRFFDTDIIRFMEHVDRVCPYVDGWGPEGKEADAFAFMINH